MSIRRDHLILGGVALSALLAGIALGHWGLPSPLPPRPVARAPALPNEPLTTAPEQEAWPSQPRPASRPRRHEGPSLAQIVGEGRGLTGELTDFVNGLGPGDFAAALPRGSEAAAVSSTDLPAAVGWAQSISDESARNSALQRVVRHVVRRDPENAPATLQGAGVPPAMLKALPSPRR